VLGLSSVLRRHPFVGAAVLLLVLAGTTRARADDESTIEARRRFARGLELVDEGAYSQAVTEFERAYRLKPNFVVLYNIGIAQAATGNAVSAVDTLERYLSEGGARIPEVRRREVEAELARQRARIAVLEIEVLPAGATVKIDGIDAGTSPLASPVRVGIGRHVVSASGPGLSPAESSIIVAGEEHGLVNLQLTAVPSNNAVALVLPPPPDADLPSRAEPEAHRPNRTLAVVSAGIGAALAATTLGVGLWNDGRYQDWSSTQRDIDGTRNNLAARGGRLDDLAARQMDNDELIRSVHRSDRVTVGLGLAGAAFVAAGIVLWFVGSDAAKSAQPKGAASGELVRF
jgi:hypothetical protein